MLWRWPLIAIFPALAAVGWRYPALLAFYGGTSLIIMVGVVLDTMNQVKSYLLMRHYDGMMKTGKMRGRSQNIALAS